MVIVSKDVKWLNFDIAQKFMTDVFQAVGVPEADAEICSDVLITADKHGIDSHGVGRFKPIYIDRILKGIQKPVTRLDVVKDNMATAVIDGNHGMGHVIGVKAMQMAIDKAKKYGLGMTVVRNSTHYGIAGYYPLMAIKNGMAGFSGTNARPSIAPTWGVENMLGTNPMTWGFPSDDPFPFMIDCATSITQRGKIEMYDRAGIDTPAGMVIDENGKTRTDTSQILIDLVKGKAALTAIGGPGETLGGYKGYGYAAVIEIMSAAFQQGSFMKSLLGIGEDGSLRPYALGHFFLAINIRSFTELAGFKKTVGDICRALRASKKAPGAKRIYTPWEKEYEVYRERRNRGVPVDGVLQKQLIELRDRYKLKQYKFNFE